MDRDFTTQAEQNLVAACKADQGTTWDKITDKGYKTLDRLGLLKIMSSSDEYRRRVADMNNTAAADVTKIFTAARQVDQDYGTKFKDLVPTITGFKKTLTSNASAIMGLSNYQSNTDKVSNAEIQEYDDATGQSTAFVSWDAAGDLSELGMDAMAKGEIHLDANGNLVGDGSAAAEVFLAKAEGHGTFRIGGLVFNADGSAFIGAKAVADGSFSFGPNGFSIKGDASAEAGAEGKIDESWSYGDVTVSNEAEGFAGAKANAEFEATNIRTQTGFNQRVPVGAQAMAGAEGSVDPTVKIGPITVGCGIGGSVGADAGISVTEGKSYQNGVYSEDLGLSGELGLGADIHPSISVDTKPEFGPFGF
jgi:hypothetical protein